MSVMMGKWHLCCFMLLCLIMFLSFLVYFCDDGWSVPVHVLVQFTRSPVHSLGSMVVSGTNAGRGLTSAIDICRYQLLKKLFRTN